jgi:flagellar biogenesis protein FliO
MISSMNIHYKILSLLADAAAPSPDVTEALPSYEGAFLKMILTLLALVVGIIGTVWFMRRLSGGRLSGGSSRSIKILEKKALSPKTMLYVIEVEGKQTVIAESQLEIKRLMTLELLDEEIKE